MAPALLTIEQAEAFVRLICAPFGPHSDAQWRRLTDNWMKKTGDGWQPNYDPRIAEPFRATMPEKDLELWPLYDAVRCPTLVLRGEQSDLLSRQTDARNGIARPESAGIRGTRCGACADPDA